MKNNPVYKREMLVRSRSFRIPLIIMIFNGILAVVALLNMYQSIAQVKVSGSVRYENFLQLYAFVAALEFMLLMFIMPALTSASISGERERHTLELMFTTKIRPVEIVVGKLMSATHMGMRCAGAGLTPQGSMFAAMESAPVRSSTVIKSYFIVPPAAAPFFGYAVWFIIPERQKFVNSGRGALCDNDRNDRFLCGRFQQNIQVFSETGVDKLRGRILQ